MPIMVDGNKASLETVNAGIGQLISKNNSSIAESLADRTFGDS